MKNDNLKKRKPDSGVPEPESTVPVTVRLPVHLVEQVTVMAAQAGVDRSFIIRRAIEDGLLVQSLSALVAFSTEQMGLVKYNSTVISSALGDVAERLSALESAISTGS